MQAKLNIKEGELTGALYECGLQFYSFVSLEQKFTYYAYMPFMWYYVKISNCHITNVMLNLLQSSGEKNSYIS